MNDKFTNGTDWERMIERLLDLSDVLGEAARSLSFAWQPKMLTTWSEKQAWEAWREQEAGNIASIHAAARELVRAGRLVDPSPEVVYFLGVRLHAGIRHLESICAIVKDRPVSFVPFPPGSMNDYAEWLLTEWGDDHASTIVFPEGVFDSRTSLPEPSAANL